MNPRIRDGDRLRSSRSKRAAGGAEVHERIVENDLRDACNGVAAVLDDQRDAARAERRLCDAHVAALGCAVVPGGGERQRYASDGDDAEDDRSDLHSTTSKNPIQPSAAISLLCAWNM